MEERKDLISRDFIKSLGGECIAARDSKTHELLPISSIDALPSAHPDEIAIQLAYMRGKIDGIKECTEKLRKLTEEFK